MRTLKSLLLIACVAAAGCASQVRSVATDAPEAQDCVVLLHGLSRSYRAMRPMAEALNEAGFATVNVDYPSRSAPIETLAPTVIGEGVARCRELGFERIHFVTHSLGGILLRYQHAGEPISELRRVVMLGPPNQGSELVDVGADLPLFGAVASAAGEQLGTGPDSLPQSLGPVDFDLGVVAGTRTANPFASLLLPNPDDGKVSLARTKVGGMKDFIAVERSHAFMMRSRDVIESTIAFLRTGCFRPGDDGFTCAAARRAPGPDRLAGS
jgi:pimeloyl-ACP methyl ester carboxylesterase